MPTVVFIYGIGHSGSTALSLALGRQQKYASLGEINTFLTSETVGFHTRESPLPCSCGAEESECPFWGPVVNALKAAPNLSPEQRYVHVFNHFEKHFGPDRIAVDASKETEALQRVASLNYVDLRVIFLVRDVRGWICSIRDRAIRRGQYQVVSLIKEFGFVRGIKRFLASRPIVLCLLWYRSNIRRQNLLRKLKVPYLTLGYEEFALNSDAALQQIGAFVGTKSPDVVEDHKHSNHVIRGNMMRFDKNMSTIIRYDKRWMQRSDWMFAWLLFPFVRKWNHRNVYDASQSKRTEFTEKQKQYVHKSQVE